MKLTKSRMLQQYHLWKKIKGNHRHCHHVKVLTSAEGFGEESGVNVFYVSSAQWVDIFYQIHTFSFVMLILQKLFVELYTHVFYICCCISSFTTFCFCFNLVFLSSLVYCSVFTFIIKIVTWRKREIHFKLCFY